MIDLSGKTALVTGGGRGIGRAITEALVQAGAFVYVTYKNNPDPAWELASKLATSEAPRVLPLYYDVTRQCDYKGLKKILDRGLDILVSNAGINRPAALSDITLEDWQAVIDANLTGAFLLVQALLPMVKDGGSIVFIGSSSAFTGGPVSTHYASSKLGLVALMQSVALNGAGRGIRSNLVSPGYVESPMAAEAMAESENIRKMVDRVPMGRMGRPEEVAGAVLWLTSSLASYVTGQVVRVDGGLTW